jgi:PAS domain S-box-containing protein
MSKRKKEPRQSNRLKDRVEAFLNKNMAAIKKTPPADIRNLFEDMLIYQTELEKHNKEIRIEAERGATETEAFYRRLAESATDLICVINIDEFGFDYASPSIASMSGYTIQEFMRLNVYDVLVPGSAAKILEVLEQEIEKEKRGKAQPQRLELEGINKDGSIIWVEASVRFLRNNSGKVTGILCVAREITKRKDIEKKLIEKEAKYQAIFNQTHSFVGLLTTEGRLLEANDSALTFGGLTEPDVLGKLFWETPWWTHDTQQQEVLRDSIHRAAEGELVQFEAHHFDKEGNIYFADFTVKPVRGDDGKIIFLIPEGRDITWRKNAENTLIQAKLEIEEKVKARTAEIEEKNIALKVLLNQREDDKKKLEETMMSNVKELLLPGLSRLKSSMIGTKQESALRVLEANLNEIISPFADSSSSIYMKLTPMEIQVANYIKHGATSKEIAESLGLSQRTVDTHRYNIRKKIGIGGKGTNLRTYLSTLV